MRERMSPINPLLKNHYKNRKPDKRATRVFFWEKSTESGYLIYWLYQWHDCVLLRISVAFSRYEYLDCPALAARSLRTAREKLRRHVRAGCH